MDKDKNGKIDREELSDFIFHGMLLSQEDRLQYSQQGRLHDTIMQFFAGVDKARELFNKKGKDALDEYMEDIADPSIKVKEIRAYVERSLWQNYDADEKDKIDFNSTKKMIEDLTKLKEITTKQCKAFIKSVNAKSENLVKEPFILFLVNHPYHTMAVQEQETYSKGGEIQLLTVQFMEGINKKSKNFRDKETKEIEAWTPPGGVGIMH